MPTPDLPPGLEDHPDVSNVTQEWLDDRRALGYLNSKGKAKRFRKSRDGYVLLTYDLNGRRYERLIGSLQDGHRIRTVGPHATDRNIP